MGALAAGIAGGCGHRTDLPQESAGGIIPPTNTYTVKQVWEGFDGASDIVLTSGSQIYVAFPDQGRVVGYFSTGTEPRANGKVMEGVAPRLVEEGAGRTLVVADVGDAGEEVVRVFDQADGAEVRAFRDTSWVEIGGVATDPSGAIYVSDRGSDRVRKYDAEGTFLLELADQGSGIGFVQAPDGLDWQPDQLLVVDSGKQWVQGLDTHEPNLAFFFLSGAESPLGPFVGLADVAGDDEGNLYIADSTSATVLKYDAEGAFDQRVEQNAPQGSNGHLANPVAVSASPTLVYVIDEADGTVVTFELDR